MTRSRARYSEQALLILLEISPVQVAREQLCGVIKTRPSLDRVEVDAGDVRCVAQVVDAPEDQLFRCRHRTSPLLRGGCTSRWAGRAAETQPPADTNAIR